MRRRHVLKGITAGVVALSGCLSSEEEDAAREVAELLDSDYEYGRDVLTNAFDRYEKGLNEDSDVLAEANFDAAGDVAQTAGDILSDHLREAQNGVRSAEGWRRELYELTEEHLRLANGAAHSLIQASDEQLMANEGLAEENWQEANERLDRSAEYGQQLADELARVE